MVSGAKVMGPKRKVGPRAWELRMSEQQPLLDSMPTAGHDISDIDDIVLQRHTGEVVSLHRYAGRWLVLRVVDDPGAIGQTTIQQGFNAIALNVVLGSEVTGVRTHTDDDTVVFDKACRFRRVFPSLSWPATFIIDPDGQLAAILKDDSYDVFVRSLIGTGRGVTSRGAVDLGEIGG